MIPSHHLAPTAINNTPPMDQHTSCVSPLKSLLLPNPVSHEQGRSVHPADHHPLSHRVTLLKTLIFSKSSWWSRGHVTVTHSPIELY